MNPIGEITKMGDCVGMWSAEAGECEGCLLAQTCRRKTEESTVEIGIDKTPIDMLIDATKNDFYLLEVLHFPKNGDVLKLARHSIAVYVIVGEDNVIQAKIWGKTIHLGQNDVTRFAEYNKMLVEKVDAGEGG